jgi:cytochrome c
MNFRTGLILAAMAAGLAAPALAAEGDVAAGEKVFNKCKACHQVGADAKNRVGPVLNGVIGRPIASVPDFKYSDAFVAKNAEGFVWTEETFHDYIGDPKGYIPGNKMAFAGLRKEEEIQNVLAYLESVAAQ